MEENCPCGNPYCGNLDTPSVAPSRSPQYQPPPMPVAKDEAAEDVEATRNGR